MSSRTTDDDSTGSRPTLNILVLRSALNQALDIAYGWLFIVISGNKVLC
jgi:hypothetical protein